jgi:hypothetical protein
MYQLKLVFYHSVIVVVFHISYHWCFISHIIGVSYFISLEVGVLSLPFEVGVLSLCFVFIVVTVVSILSRLFIWLFIFDLG